MADLAVYFLKFLRLSAAGMRTSFSPPRNSKGARALLRKLIVAIELGVTFERAACQIARPGAGITSRSNSPRASDSESVLAKTFHHFSKVKMKVFLNVLGCRKIGVKTRYVDNGKTRIPLGGTESIATPATPKPLSMSSWAMRPPKECPMMIGGSDRPRMIAV